MRSGREADAFRDVRQTGIRRSGLRSGAKRILLGLAIGLALADSSIVTLALPEILGELDVGITEVAWVLTSFNLVLAVVVLPAAYVARRRPRGAFVVGTAVFAASSLACGLAPWFELLLAARCIQAVGAALVVVAALALLSNEPGAVRLWVTAGVLGAALGPALGGVLTELLGWRSIFLAQVPAALVPLVAVRRSLWTDRHAIGTPQCQTLWSAFAANSALFLLSGGLVAAFFLVVLLLVEGWGMSPAAAGLVVMVLPLAAIAAARLVPATTSGRVRIASGVILVAGGLGALAVLPRAGWVWTIAPQVLVGAGLGLTLGDLTERAVARRDAVVGGGWTIASRHAGVVAGLLVLAPLLTEALERSSREAVRAGTAVVLDSRVPAIDKLRVAQDVLREVDDAERRGELPRVERVFDDRPDDDEHQALASALQAELDRAVTDAFSNPFLFAAALALAALLPVAAMRGAPR
jgi:MFS family permease